MQPQSTSVLTVVPNFSKTGEAACERIHFRDL